MYNIKWSHWAGVHTKGHFAMVGSSREKASRDVHLKPFNAENKLLFAEERMTHTVVVL